jgi:hypothetical protein
MGQIFYACAYDIENTTCCVIESDKFHANCYAHSGSVHSMHYLLRQKPYRILWGGIYMIDGESLKSFSEIYNLLGLSTYLYYEDFESCIENIQNESYYDQVKFIGAANKLWNRINVYNEALEYFNWKKTYSVKYKGYLINHSQKLAIDLNDYYERSKFSSTQSQNMAIDAVPVLTETGGGTQMALFDGISVDSTEELAGKWAGDLLQIVDNIPTGYELLDFCIAEVWGRAQYCYDTFGINERKLLIDRNGRLLEATMLDIGGERGTTSYIKVDVNEKEITYTPTPVHKNEKNNSAFSLQPKIVKY